LRDLLVIVIQFIQNNIKINGPKLINACKYGWTKNSVMLSLGLGLGLKTNFFGLGLGLGLVVSGLGLGLGLALSGLGLGLGLEPLRSC